MRRLPQVRLPTCAPTWWPHRPEQPSSKSAATPFARSSGASRSARLITSSEDMASVSRLLHGGIRERADLLLWLMRGPRALPCAATRGRKGTTNRPVSSVPAAPPEPRFLGLVALD